MSKTLNSISGKLLPLQTQYLLCYSNAAWAALEEAHPGITHDRYAASGLHGPTPSAIGRAAKYILGQKMYQDSHFEKTVSQHFEIPY